MSGGPFDELARDSMQGGPVMLLIMMLGCVGTFGGVAGFVLALTIAQSRTLLFAGALMGLGVLAPIAGTLGYSMGRSSMEEALAHVSPEDVEITRMVGTSEALTCLQYGLGAGLLPFCLGLALVGIGLVRLRPSPA